MHRRSFLAATLALVAGTPACAATDGAPAGNRTRWNVRGSEGFDAIAFLGPLSGTPLYLTYYAQEAAEFAPRLPEAIRDDIRALWAQATAEGFGLLGPNLAVLFSGNDASLDTLLAALRDRETRIRPGYAQSPYWIAKDWEWFDRAAPRLERIFAALREADFAGFRARLVGTGLDARIAEVRHALRDFDVIHWQQKLTGRTFDPGIEIVLLRFSKPHGIKVQGQTFLQASDYDIPTTVRIAAHEMLHPPVPMKGSAATAALRVLQQNPLLERIVREHDPALGYNTLEGLFDEDLVQALDQLIGEALGVAHDPAVRWRTSDEGMHVLAAGLYGLLRQDGWVETGGNIERWLAEAARRGRLAPGVLHAAAAGVLNQPVDQLWPANGAAG